MLSPWQWVALSAVPPAVVLLYFLKLKRQPLEVPSTWLWRKSIEDLRVNSLWQRLRQSLLLFLQLLLLLLLLIALGRPSWRGSRLGGDRYIFLIDNSASMSATDIGPSRLEEAKRQVHSMIDAMASSEKAMVVSFSDGAQVEQPFTDNRSELRRKVDEIKQTDRTTSIAEALRVAGGLANPGRSSNPDDVSDVKVAQALPARLLIFSDGKVAGAKDFSVGNLTPVFVPIGKNDAKNIGIVALSTARKEENAERLQAFGRVENFGSQPGQVDVELYLDGTLIDADQVAVKPGESTGVAFDLGETISGVLELRLGGKDDLRIDDRAWTTVNETRRAKLLLVTPGNEPLALTLGTGKALEMADVAIRPPDYLESPEYKTAAAGGLFDLVVFDRCAPRTPEEMPQSNTLFIGTLPPGAVWKAKAKVDAPQIIDVDRTHPLMQLVQLDNVVVAAATPLEVPVGGTILVDSNRDGALFAIAPRAEYQDAVMGFEIVSKEGVDTNWPVRLSFAVFGLNLIEYLGGSHSAVDAGSVRPGQNVDWKSDTAANSIRFITPSRKTIEVPRSRLNTFKFTTTDEVGIYEVHEGTDAKGRLAVNLFDPRESDIRPSAEIKIGHVEVVGQTGWEATRQDAWKALVLIGLAVLFFEWYIYNRRVYL